MNISHDGIVTAGLRDVYCWRSCVTWHRLKLSSVIAWQWKFCPPAFRNLTRTLVPNPLCTNRRNIPHIGLRGNVHVSFPVSKEGKCVPEDVPCCLLLPRYIPRYWGRPQTLLADGMVNDSSGTEITVLSRHQRSLSESGSVLRFMCCPYVKLQHFEQGDWRRSNANQVQSSSKLSPKLAN